MLTLRKLPVVVFAAFALLTGLLAGCSSSKDSGELPDATKLLQESTTATTELSSVHLTLSVNGKIEKLPVKTLEGDLTTEPTTAAKGDAKITFGGSDVDIDFVVYDADLYASLTKDAWDNYGPAADIYDPSAILNPETGLANMLSNFTDAKAEAHETLDGQDTVRVSGKATADAVNKIAPQLNATEAMPASVWIQADDPHQLVQAKLDQSSDNSVVMTLSNWNAPVTIDKPAA